MGVVAVANIPSIPASSHRRCNSSRRPKATQVTAIPSEDQAQYERAGEHGYQQCGAIRRSLICIVTNKRPDTDHGGKSGRGRDDDPCGEERQTGQVGKPSDGQGEERKEGDRVPNHMSVALREVGGPAKLSRPNEPPAVPGIDLPQDACVRTGCGNGERDDRDDSRRQIDHHRSQIHPAPLRSESEGATSVHEGCPGDRRRLCFPDPWTSAPRSRCPCQLAIQAACPGTKSCSFALAQPAAGTDLRRDKR